MQNCSFFNIENRKFSEIPKKSCGSLEKKDSWFYRKWRRRFREVQCWGCVKYIILSFPIEVISYSRWISLVLPLILTQFNSSTVQAHRKINKISKTILKNEEGQIITFDRKKLEMMWLGWDYAYLAYCVKKGSLVRSN